MSVAMRRAAPLLAPVYALALSFSQPAFAQETSHVVESGETLNGIANRAGVSPADLARANGLEPPYIVRIGQRLTIPGKSDANASTPSAPARSDGEYQVTSGETLNGIANRTGVSAAALAQANGLAEPYMLRVGQTLKIPGKSSAPGRVASRTVASREPAPAPSQTTGETYTVTSGETLGGIANRTGVPRVLIAEANGLTPPYTVRVGQVLHIPRTRHHTVANGETGFAVALKYGVPWDQIAVANGLEPGAPLPPGKDLLIPTVLNPASTASAAPVASKPATATTSRFIWPVKGPIRRGFATGTDYHDGIDIQAAKGTMVRAAADGTVLYADKRDEFGNLVVVDHGGGYYTAYAFLSRITVKKGAKVTQGERVGLVGSTGLAKGNELHFELRKNGKPVNPVDELPKAP